MWSMSLLLPVLAALGAHAKSKGASVPQRLRADVGQWLRSARPGYCANTGWGLEAKSLCRSGEKGVLPLNRRAFLSWPDAVASCMKLCRTCANCNFITVSLSFKDCSWYRSCNRPENDIKGFRSAPVNRTRTRRRRTFRLPAHVLATRDRRAVPNEVALRYGELLNYSQGSYNLTGVSALMQHPRLASTIHRGIHLAPSGRRWTPKELETYAESVYAKHNAQTATQRTALRQKWRAPIVGATKVWDLVQLLHFTIDHTDVALMYTSQLIHCLQVFVTVSAFPWDRSEWVKNDPTYEKDMRIAALVHDMGKLLTLFGERDHNVDCMNRVLNPTASTGIDGLEFAWNHDDFGHFKMRQYLPPRVLDVMRLHSLREVPYSVYTTTSHSEEGLPDISDPTDLYRIKPTRAEAQAFKRRLSNDDKKRAKFVAHFQWFDARSKSITDEIPTVDIDSVHELIDAYFPNGEIEW